MSPKHLHHRNAIEALEKRQLLSTAYLLTTNNQIQRFDTSNPGLVTDSVDITGLQTDEFVVAIDVRPATGGLYGIGDSSRLYLIDPFTGAATAVGGVFDVPLSGDSFDIDFNPSVDRIRLVSNTDQNMRLNPNTGAVVDGDAVTAGVQGDTALLFDAGDTNSAADPLVGGLAYTNNFSGASTTTLFGIDSALNILLTQGSAGGSPTSPNAGTLFTVGSINIDASKRIGFDIESANGGHTAFAVLQVSGTARASLYSINLTTGAGGVVGRLGTTRRVADLAIAPQNFGVLAVTPRNELVAFSSQRPGNTRSLGRITGLRDGERIVGIDFRPASDELFGLGDQDYVYRINPSNGRATQIGDIFTLGLSGDSFGVDFNPVPDRLRVTSNAAQNLRINPDTGAVVDGDVVTAGVQGDTNLAFDGADANTGAAPVVAGSAYTNSFAGSTTTSLFNIDSALNILVRQGSAGGTPVSPNTGTLFTVGALGADVIKRVGFDIASANGQNKGLAVMQVDGQAIPGLYDINLNTGAATRIGDAGTGQLFSAMAIRPA